MTAKPKKKIVKKVKTKQKKVTLEDTMPKNVVLEIGQDWKAIINEENADKAGFKLFGESEIQAKSPLAVIHLQEEERGDDENHYVDEIQKEEEVVEENGEEDIIEEEEEFDEAPKEKRRKPAEEEEGDEETKKRRKRKKKWLQKIDGEDLEKLYVQEFGMSSSQFKDYQRYREMIAEKRKKDYYH